MDLTIKPTKREVLIDYFRGLAVALMIFTHVVGLTYVGKNSLINNLSIIGGIASFTMFLFISGFSAYFGLIKYTNEDPILPARKLRFFARTIQLLGIYYILAVASALILGNTGTSIPSNLNFENLASGLPKIFFFITVPEYTEFLLSFVIFGLLVVFLRPVFKFLVEKSFFGFVVGFAFFVLGYLLSGVTFDGLGLVAIKALIAGSINPSNPDTYLHTFPIFQYLSIYLLGMLFARLWLSLETDFQKYKIVITWTIIFSILTTLSFITFEQTEIKLFEVGFDSSLPGRFPPSFGFLSLSMFIAFASFLFLLLFKNFLPGLIKATIHFMGSNPLEMFFLHLAIIFGFRYLTMDESVSGDVGMQFDGTFSIILFYLFILLLCIIFTNSKNQFKAWSLENTETEVIWWGLTERALSSFVIITVLVIAGANFYKDVLASGSAETTSNVQFKKRLIREEEWPFWWDHQYNAFRQIIIKPQNTIPEKTWIEVSFDHARAVREGKSLDSNGKDIRVVFYDENLGVFKELPFFIENPNSENTKLIFQTEKLITSNEEIDTYFIYYGKKHDDHPQPELRPNSTLSQGITVLNERTHSVTGRTNKKWYLRKKETAFQAASLVFEAEIISDTISASPIVTYSILGTDKFGRMDKVSDKKYSAKVVVSDLDPGVYTIQANITEPGENLKVVRSKAVEFYITYPLYVTWTQDWEGFDVSENNLNAMANTADSYGMPMVHLFNPRIYVQNQYSYKPISQDRAQYLTSWVRERQKNKYEEIGMHIHMFPDMVQEAGVQPRYQAGKTAMYGDAFTYIYTEEELTKVFRWGREKLSGNGLGLPISYRTGAWMSGVNVLKAAQNAGFLIDTTGRTGGSISQTNPNYLISPWNLTETTYPYLPSVNDINSWEGERLEIWEFPNNGADSYWYGEAELRRRFDLNYPNKNSYLSRPQVVTYLTHPHWYQQVDEPKIRGLFSYISQFKFDDDNGPVVFATLEEIYAQWPRDTFYNGD